MVVSNKSNNSLFLYIFSFTFLLSLFFQLIFLPQIVPELHAGNGLIKSGDWNNFHRASVELATRMDEHGWSVWQLYPLPKGWSVVGIVSAIYYITGFHEPWVLLPLQVMMFTLSALLLRGILRNIYPGPFSTISILPFILFPSSVHFYSQILKDTYSILGMLILIYSWTLVLNKKHFNAANLVILILLYLCGVSIVWMVRPYLIYVFIVSSFPLFIFLLYLLSRHFDFRQMFFSLIIVTIPFVFVANNNTHYQKDIKHVFIPDSVSSKTTLERLIFIINNKRGGFVRGNPNANTNIDVDVQFNSMNDLIRYIPRAITIGLFYPRPNQYSSELNNLIKLLKYKISSLEMFITYVLYFGILLFFILIPQNNYRAMCLFVLVVSIIILISMVVSNMGTLYRMRYPYLQILNCLGLIGWFEFFRLFKLRLIKIHALSQSSIHD